MGRYIEGVFESFRKSLNVNLWLNSLGINVVAFLATGIIVLLLFAGMIAMLLPYFGGQASAIELMQKIISDVPKLLITAAVLFFIFLVLSIFVQAYFIGAGLNQGRDFLEGKGLSIFKVLRVQFGRAILEFMVIFIMLILGLALFLMLMLPSLFGIIDFLPKISSLAAQGTQALAGEIYPIIMLFTLNLIVAVCIVLLLELLLSPFLWCLAPVVFFEKEGFFGSVKRALKLGFSGYLGSLGYILLFCIIVFIVSLPFSIINFIISTALPNIAGGILGFIIMLPYSMWAFGFGNAAMVNLYKIKAKL